MVMPSLAWILGMANSREHHPTITLSRSSGMGSQEPRCPRFRRSLRTSKCAPSLLISVLWQPTLTAPQPQAILSGARLFSKARVSASIATGSRTKALGSRQLPGFSERNRRPMNAKAPLLVSVVLSSLLSASISSGQVSFERILGADKEPQNWLTYSGTTLSQRHSLLNQITPANVKNLELQWIYQARSLEKFEATPLVVDGIMYTVQTPNHVIALDAATGRVFWTYSHHPVRGRPCCGRVNRGLAILDDILFMGTIDAHLIAIDAKHC